jgi:hypothetical protein
MQVEGNEGEGIVPPLPLPSLQYPSVISSLMGGALGLGWRSAWAEDGAALECIVAAASHGLRALRGGIMKLNLL